MQFRPIGSPIATRFWRRYLACWRFRCTFGGGQKADGEYGFLALGCLTLSLLSAEAGIASCAYLLAYQLTCDRGTFWKRLGKLIPYVLIVASWRIAWNWHGCDGVV